jgi:hypothetical protein
LTRCVELYRALRGGESIEESAAGAQRELERGQQLQLEMAVLLAAKMLVKVFGDPPPVFRNAHLEPLQRIEIARQAWNRWFPTALQDQQPAYGFENVLPNLRI